MIPGFTPTDPNTWSRYTHLAQHTTLTRRRLIRSGCGLKLRGTGSVSRPGQIFVIGVVHIQYTKLFKGLECAVLSIALCTIKNPWSHSTRLGFNADFADSLLSRYCHDCAKSDVKQYSFSTHNTHTLCSVFAHRYENTSHSDCSLNCNV